jgi:hypothetical protein
VFLLSLPVLFSPLRYFLYALHTVFLGLLVLVLYFVGVEVYESIEIEVDLDGKVLVYFVGLEFRRMLFGDAGLLWDGVGGDRLLEDVVVGGIVMGIHLLRNDLYL